MNTQELMAVSDLINACGTLNNFSHDAVMAVKKGLPLELPEEREHELQAAMVSVRIALNRLQPRILLAIDRANKTNG